MYKITFFLLTLTQVALAQKQITINDIFKDNVFKQETVASLNWMNNGKFYTALEDNKVKRYLVASGEMDSVLVDGDLLNLSLDDYEFAADESRILLLTDKKKIYRRSFTAEYYIYSFDGSEVQKLSSNGRQSYATISPDNKMIAFVRDNNLFYTKLVNMVEYQVTNDGAFGRIINGSSDWVYEEELYLTKAFEWAPNAQKLAYYKFDESKVKEYNLQKWGKEVYPTDYKYKYPKAGEDNAKVSIHVYDLKDNSTVMVDLGEETDMYVPQIQWTQNSNLLAIKRLNRLQNRQDIYHANATTGNATIMLTDKSKTHIDATFTTEWVYLNNGTHFLMSSERDGFKHFYIHRMDGQLEYKSTEGSWEAESLIGLDQRSKTPVLYYMSTQDSPLERHLYKVDFKGKGKTRLTPKSGVNKVDMSKDFKYYINFHSSADTPKEVSLVAAKGNAVVKVLKDNAKLKETIAEYGLTKKVLFQLDAADKKLLNAYMLQPLDMDSTKQYPVLMHQYSGPGSQEVKNDWAGRHYLWHQYLVQKGYIVVVVDPRGTGGRGEDFKKMTYLKMGKLESEDMVASANYLGSLPFIDQERIGIWGWSYGGYMSSLSLMMAPDTFKAGIAVAPFIWKYYDTVYSERYLRKPQDNFEGYNEYSIIANAPKLKSKYLLIHGTGDDNVHFQSAVFLQNALINNGTQFESFYYPDNTHSLPGKKTKIHLYTMMTNFVLNNL